MGQIKIDKADSVFSQWIRLRDKQCVRCHSLVRFNEKGYPNSHQASHFKGRKKEATRFEPLNVDTLCHGCHAYFTSQPDEHYHWQVETKGQDVIDRIILQSNSYYKKQRHLEYIYWKQKLKEDYNL